MLDVSIINIKNNPFFILVVVWLIVKLKCKDRKNICFLSQHTREWLSDLLGLLLLRSSPKHKCSALEQ